MGFSLPAFNELATGFGNVTQAPGQLYRLGQNLANPNVNYLGKANPGIVAANNSYNAVAGQDLNALHQQGNQVAAQRQVANDAAANAPYNAAKAAQAAQTARDQADEQAYWQDQLNNADSLLARLGGQKQTGYGNIDSSYNQARAGLQSSQNQAKQQYDTTKTRAVRDNTQAKENIDSGVVKQLTGLQRLLGAKGAGQGSTARILAPYQVGQAGNQQRQQVQQAYGDNITDLDNNWAATDTQFTNAYGQLDQDRDQKRRDLEAQFATTEAGLLDQKGQAAVSKGQAGGQTYTQARNARTPYQSRIQQLMQQIDGLGANSSFTPKQVQYQDPSLRAYNYDNFQGPTQQQGVDPNLAQGTGAYWTLLPGDKEKKQALQPAY